MILQGGPGERNLTPMRQLLTSPTAEYVDRPSNSSLHDNCSFLKGHKMQDVPSCVVHTALQSVERQVAHGTSSGSPYISVVYEQKWL